MLLFFIKFRTFEGIYFALSQRDKLKRIGIFYQTAFSVRFAFQILKR